MTERRSGTDDESTDLRQRAEARSRRPDALGAADLEELSPPAARQLLHELQVHQIELELQNEELRRTQLELEAAQARYFDLYELAPVGYFTLSEAGLILTANLTVATLLGVDRAALVNRPVSRFILAADQEVYYRHRARLLETGAPQVCEVRMRRAGAEHFWARMEATVRQDAAGAPVYSAAVSDVTERRQAEEQLRASEERFRAVFDHVSDGILLTDLTTKRLVLGNRAMCRMLGYAEDEIASLAHADLHPAAALPALMETFDRMTHGEVASPHDLPMLRKDGTVLVAEVSGALAVIGGRPFAMGCFRDVTERRKLKASLAQSDRLSSMGLLAAGVAHEINNPLAYVLYNVESLAQDLPRLAAGPLPPAALEDLAARAREALEGTLRIKDISRSLGTFSRVERNEFTAVDLNDAIDHAAAMAHNEIKFRARLVKDLGPVPAVWASPGKLAQVFLNLLINAAHAIDEGHVEQHRIAVRTWTEGHAVLAAVTDTGKGIPPENLERIFEPFFTTKKVGEGSGLGLAICRNIIAGFGGTLTVESQVGRGTRFVVRLPLPAEGAGAPTEEAAPAAAPGPAVRGRILVIDDEPAVRRSLTRLLERAHEIVTASSGAEGQAILERDRAFDVILCDLMMPDLSGMELHEWLTRTDPALARRVLFLTGGAFTPRAAEYLARVGNPRLEKPFDAANVARLVAELVAAARRPP